MPDEHRDQRGTGSYSGDDPRAVSRPLVAELGHAEEEGGDAGGQQDEPAQVQPGGGGRPGRREEPHRGEDRGQAHRHVDVEDPPPARVLDDRSADDRAEGGDEQHWQAEQAHHASQPGRAGGLCQGGLADQARPARTEPSMNVASEAIQTCRAPNRAAAQPDRGITLAKASMYPVSTHWIVAMEVPSSRPNVGMATLTMVRSRTVMAVPRMTTIASRTISRSKVGAVAWPCCAGMAGGF